jgi:hypothetical protein
LHGVRILDGTEPGARGGLEFDLPDVLAALGERVSNSRWRCRLLWYTSTDEQDIDVLHRMDQGELVDGHILLGAIDRLMQVIDGEFEGVEAEGAAPWVLIRAVDSAWWEGFSDDPSVLVAIRGRFRVVHDL